MSRSRTRRIAKWVGLVMCVFIGTTLVASRWWAAGWMSGRYVAFLQPRGVLLFRSPATSPSEWWFEERTHPDSHASIWSFRYSPRRHNDCFSLRLPLWLPLLAITIPTFILWRRDRRYPPGHCQRCGYDLTGNVTGVCSECGTKADGP